MDRTLGQILVVLGEARCLNQQREQVSEHLTGDRATQNTSNVKEKKKKRVSLSRRT
jgi:hypothetical protein